MIRDMPKTEKPREKAMAYGVRELSTRELLAILLRTGCKGKSVLEVADEVLKKAGGTKGLDRLGRKELIKIRGISNIKALEMEACFELTRRIMREKSRETDVISHPDDMIDWLRRELTDTMQEHMLAVFLDGRNHIMSHRLIYIGSGNVSIASPKDILHQALVNNAMGMILVHNHPAGSLQPSDSDIRFTERMVLCSSYMGIRFLDHMIVTKDGYFSFSHAGILNDIMASIRNEW